MQSPIETFADRLRADPAPEVLYHYTAADGLLGILGNSSIYATSVRSLNDRSEFTLALRNANAYLEEVENTSKNAVHAGLARRWRNGFGGSRPANTYVTSFSTKGDVLSQWRAYGKGVGGYAIGFDSSVLKATAFHLLKCQYNVDAHAALMADVIEEHLKHYDHLVRQGASPADASADCELSLATVLAVLAPTLKDPAFEEEHEWRLVSTRIRPRNEEVRFRKGDSMIVPYVEVPLGLSATPTGVRRIVVGPTPNVRASMATVRMLLEHHGFDGAKVARSKAPYRAW